MPQLTLEYTENVSPVDFKALFSALHGILTDIGGVRIGNCKSRAVRHSDFHIADGAPEGAFVHLTVRVLDGRSLEWKTKLGAAMLETVKAHYGHTLDALALQITVHISELERNTYFKWPEGTFTPLEQTA